MSDNPERAALGSIFDRTFRALNDLPDVIGTKPATIRHVTPVLELTQTFIVQTKRQKEVGDNIFIEYIGAEGSFRMHLPPAVAERIALQRDALTTKNPKRAAKLEAASRKARGIKEANARLISASPDLLEACRAHLQGDSSLIRAAVEKAEGGRT